VSTHAVHKPQPSQFPATSARASVQDPKSGSQEPQPGKDFVRGEVLVTYKDQASTSTRANSIKAKGDQLKSTLRGRPNIASVQVKSGRSVQEAVQAYKADPDVKHAQPNYIYRIQKTPNDPMYSDLWGLKNYGQGVDGDFGTSGRDIGAEAAWDTRTDCSNVTVAVLDTGINYEHADLAGNMWDDGSGNPGKDTVENDSDPIPNGGQYHGTHVAGTIAAVGDNDTGTTGVCWNAQIMAVRVLGPDGMGSTSDIVEGIDYARTHGADIINMSLGGSGDPSTYEDTSYEQALADARDAGILAVVAAGNANDNVDSGNATYPCAFDLDNIICVAALNQDYSLASYSNYGATSVDVGAPGSNILSAWPGEILDKADLSAWENSNTTAPNWEVDTNGNAPWGGNTLGFPNGFYGNQGYSNNRDNWAYRTFDLSQYMGYSIKFYADLETEYNYDYVRVWKNPNGVDPKGATDSKKAGEWSGYGEAVSYKISAPLDGCLTSTCSVAFQFYSDSLNTEDGAAIGGIALQTVQSAATATDIINGTSMATPHVTGIAALAWAQDTSRSYSEIRQAVLDGGDRIDALDAKTSTGQAADADGTLVALTNDAPSASDTSGTTSEGSSVDISLEGTDPDGHSLTWSVKSVPANGSVTISGSTATYSPNSGYVGSDSFQVQAADGYGGTATATVSISVNALASGGGGGSGGCTLASGPQRPDPLWALLLLAPWLLRRRGGARYH
jgi:subtilisin family serine protease